MKLSTIAARNILRNKRRSILSIGAIALAAMSIVFLFSFLEGMKNDLADNLQSYYTGEIRVRHKDFGTYEYLNPLHLRIENYEDIVKEIEINDAVKTVAPRIRFPAGVYRSGEMYRAFGMGVDFQREKSYQDIERYIITGRLPEAGRKETLLGAGLAREIGVATGDKITILATTMRRGSNAVTLRITGIARFPVNSFNKNYLLMPLDRAQRLLHMDDSVSEILIKLNRGTSSIKVAERLNTSLYASGKEELGARFWKQISSSYSFIETASSLYNFIAIFFFILASSVIINTTMMVVHERRKEIGTIGALGMTGGEIVRLFFFETVFLSTAGSLIGVILGIGVTLPFSVAGIHFGKAMEGVSIEISNSIYPALNLKSTALVFVYSICAASLATLIPSIKAARVKPVEALRNI